MPSEQSNDFSTRFIKYKLKFLSHIEIEDGSQTRKSDFKTKMIIIKSQFWLRYQERQNIMTDRIQFIIEPSIRPNRN